ncbi:DUF916 and DUF3324 domain-containing protein [Levilactobacillus huananensis]|uniref:DUF916 and DUF3324 domain-containing protein n=1 Tax=Levilactobacillus huananensis TaxID=2486019 RepID=UPI000F794EAE|nr:DUF916 and DUF3324 domain-containing protein [Levilactobacillus huananensis]
MRRGLKIMVMMGVALLLGGAQVIPGLADQTPTNNVGYTVRAVIPANQVDRQISYFDLRVKPRESQPLTIVIENTSNRSQRFRVSVNQAVTNQNGVIDYSQLSPKLDSSLKVGIANIFARDLTQKVTVPANSQKRVTLSYTMPAQKLRGIILGGVYVQQLNPVQPKASGKIMINNAYTYAIGLSLQEGATVKPDLKLKQVGASQINARNFVTANLQNDQPGLLQGLTVNARVTQAGQTQTLIQQKQAKMGMAPNSNFNFGIPWGDQNLKPGQYTLYLTANAKGQRWQFVRNFTISAPVIKRLNRHAIAPVPQPNYWLYLALGLLIASLLAIIGYLMYRNRHPRHAK